MSRLLICLLLALSALAQSAPPLPPPNPLLENHKHWFLPAEIWDIQTDPRLSAHRPKGLSYKAYSAVGFNLANTVAIVGPTGEITIIDTLGDRKSVKEMIQVFRDKKIFPSGKLPIRTIIYTHNHIDHIGGVKEFLAEASRPACLEEKTSEAGSDKPLNADSLDCVSVIGQEKIVDGVNNTATVVGAAINPRSAYMYGNLLPQDEKKPADKNWFITNGIGYKVEEGVSDFVMPSRTFSNQMTLVSGGVTMEVIYVPSETDDELAVFIPDMFNGGTGTAGMLQSAEVIQGPSFPNLYSLRGTSFRNPAQWFRSVDVLRKYDSWCMLPSHGTPLCGNDNVQKLLTNFRDAIQYTHDQSVRHMNKGYSMEQLPLLIPMPEYLIDDLATVKTAKGNNVTDPKDYLRFFYGSVPQAVRELYFGYLGWFQADPVALAPTPPQEYASKTVALMGGRDKVLAEARNAFGRKEYQWSAELATLLVTRDPADQVARKEKAAAYVALAVPQQNPNWRNFYLTAAMELNGDLKDHRAIPGGLVAPGIVEALPYGNWVNQWTWRLKAEETIKGNVNRTLGFYFTPAEANQTAEGFTLEVARGVARFTSTGASREAVKAPVVIEMGKSAQKKLVYADLPGFDVPYERVLGKLIDDGEIKVQGGTKADVLSFFALFDRAPQKLNDLAVR
ncbi:MAG TPA: alkyl sulfatase dimerization domain-containing protein [Thermoanaerobaculia bacterium]|nr:alkyl sulfatase dimerization domain-containing protein [Thermoanaerobaculia bacterium]